MQNTYLKAVILCVLCSAVPVYAQRQAVFYVADPSVLNASEQLIVDRLGVLGFTVTAIDDNLSDPADAVGQHLILICSTVGSGNIGIKHTTTAVPIINWESALFDELGLQANNANGVSIGGLTQINIVDATHPLAAGFPVGVRTIFTTAGNMSSSDNPVASARVVGREVTGSTRPLLLGVDQGAALNPARVATAPARRVGFPIENDTFQFLNADGLTLFDAAVAWAAGPDNAPIGIAQSPTNTTAVENEIATFSLIVTGAPPWSFQWQRSDGVGGFTNILGATSRTFALATKFADNSAQFRATATNAFGNATSAAATLTVTRDTTAPTIAGALTRGNPIGVFVIFSERVSPATATNAINYSINNGVTVSGASLQADGLSVLLTTTAITSGRAYQLTVNGVQDTAAIPNTIALNSQITFFQTDGVIQRRVFFVTGGTLTALTNSAKFINNQPDQVTYPTLFEGLVDSADNYGSQLRGYVTPPVSGSYVFFICSDDPSVLFLSTDENPANKKMIASETGWSASRNWVTVGDPINHDPSAKRSDQFAGSQWTPPNVITLTAGNRYYIEALHAEAGGGDNVAVLWVLPGGVDPVNGDAPISGAYLSGLGITPGPVTIATQPGNQTAQEPGTATFTVGPSGSPPFTYQWIRDGTPIPGATGQSYTTPLSFRADSGAKFKVTVANAFSSATSSEATLTVNPDTTPPRPVQVTTVSGSFRVITMNYSERMDKASTETAANYVFSPGNIVATNVTLDATTTNVTIATGTALTPNTENTLTITGAKDLSGNTVAANTTIKFTFNPVTYAANILFDGPLGYYRFEEAAGSNVATNSGTTGGNGTYSVGNELTPGDGGSPGTAKGDPGPRPPTFVGFDANNRAATFAGPTTEDWVDTKNQFLQDRAAFTLEYWVSPANRVSDPATFGSRIAIVGQNDAIEYGFINPTTIQIWTPNGGSLDTTYSFPDNEWHHVATIASGADIRNYFDGVLVGTVTDDAGGNYGTSIYNVHIGGAGGFDAANNWFTGQIDEVAIFDKAIPAARVAAHYQAGKSGGVITTSGAVTPPVGVAITLSTSRSGNILATSWTPAAAGDILESSPVLPATTWTGVGTNSPVNVTIGTGNLFLRVRRP